MSRTGQLAADTAYITVHLAELQTMCHDAASHAGWWNHLESGEPLAVDEVFGDKIALIHSEITEAYEAKRKNLRDDKLKTRPGVEVEFADAIIRILDLAGAMGLDVAGAMAEKMAFNKTRPDHTRAHRLSEHGKKT